jgi:hypothetical protein
MLPPIPVASQNVALRGAAMAAGSHRSRTETTIMTPAAKPRKKEMCLGFGAPRSRNTTPPPIVVAAPAMKEDTTGVHRSIDVPISPTAVGPCEVISELSKSSE